MAQSEQSASARAPRTGYWWRILLGCLAAFVIGILLLLLTGNPNLFPTVVNLGNLMVPAACVSFFYERRHLSQLSISTTVLGFLYGGLLGVFAASILEPIFIHGLSLPNAFLVGLIEEFAKMLGVLVIAHRRQHGEEIDGLILGVAAGMGFATLESMGYAFTAFLRSHGSLSVTVAITLLRGLLSPVGHGTWTALFVSVLFRESAGTRYRINLKVLGAFLTVVILHGLWDGLPIVIGVLFGPGLDIAIGQLLVGGFGLFLLWRRWHEAVRLQAARQAAIAANGGAHEAGCA